jgi:hypothetical protein
MVKSSPGLEEEDCGPTRTVQGRETAWLLSSMSRA